MNGGYQGPRECGMGTCLMGTLGNIKTVVEVDHGDGGTTLRMY